MSCCKDVAGQEKASVLLRFTAVPFFGKNMVDENQTLSMQACVHLCDYEVHSRE